MKNNKEKSPLIMSISGVRGIIGGSLSPQVIVNLISAFSMWLGSKGSIVLGRDNRGSGKAISEFQKGYYEKDCLHSGRSGGKKKEPFCGTGK